LRFLKPEKAIEFAKSVRKEKKVDLIVYQKGQWFHVCRDRRFFEMEINYKNIVCFLADNESEGFIVVEKSKKFFEAPELIKSTLFRNKRG